MAHSCPTCDSYCHCGGDIDDIQLDGTDEQDNCIHCPFDDFDEDEDDWPEDDDLSDEEMEDNRLAFEAEMKNWTPPVVDPDTITQSEIDDLPF